MDKLQSLNQEILRARELIAQLKLNSKKALELTHTQRNLVMIRKIVLEQIQIRRTARAALQDQSSSLSPVKSHRDTKFHGESSLMSSRLRR